MPRPPRVAFPGAVYHVTTRAGFGRRAFERDGDRRRFLADVERASHRYGWRVHTYCLMTTHYHLLVETVEPTISRGLQYLNGRYAQWFNREHARDGHLWCRRFHGELVVRDSHLLETCRYVVLNPVRAGLCRDPAAWTWSSHAAMAGLVPSPPLLTRAWLLRWFDVDRRRAERAYAAFVAAGARTPHRRATTGATPARRKAALAR